MTSAVEVVTIGDELLLGYTIDSNAAHLARTLGESGIRVTRRATCGDGAGDIAAAVREALDRTGAVITTGGLGPTSDDRTKESIATIFSRAMRLDEAIWERLRAMWKERGWPGEIPIANKQQAMIPAGATILPNRHGSAPGIWLEDDRGRWVAMLPGVPREMRGMLVDELLPRLMARGDRATVVRSRTLRTTGIGESALHDLFGDAARGVHGLPLAYLPGWEGTDVRLTVHGLAADEADRALDVAAVVIRERAGHYLYGEGTTDLADVVLAQLRSRHWKVAVAESCTGGLLGARLTAIPGSSDVVVGGVIAYDDRLKRELLAVRAEDLDAHGAVSEPVVRAMARGVRALTGADVGIGITGIAGPGGATPEKPVGTVWLSVETPLGAHAVTARLVGDRGEIRQRAAQGALNLVRRQLAT